MSEVAQITVRSLVCHRDVNMAIACLGSMLKFSHQPLQLVIHDDGSLTPEDIERLLHELKNSKVLRRAEADDLMHDQLKQYPNAYKFRNETVMGLKLLDTALLSQGNIAYCDSDILFLRPFEQVFHFPNSETSAIFMMDCREAYAVLPWQLLGTNGLKLPSRINAGLMFIRKEAYDLDFIESILSQEKYWTDPLHRLEQTCWAALGYRLGCRLWNPQKIVLVQSRDSITDQAVAGHFVSRYRYLLGEFAPKVNSAIDERSPVTAETVPSQNCNLFALSRSLIRHKLGYVKHITLKKFYKNYKAPWKYKL